MLCWDVLGNAPPPPPLPLPSRYVVLIGNPNADKQHLAFSTQATRHNFDAESVLVRK